MTLIRHPEVVMWASARRGIEGLVVSESGLEREGCVYREKMRMFKELVVLSVVYGCEVWL